MLQEACYLKQMPGTPVQSRTLGIKRQRRELAFYAQRSVLHRISSQLLFQVTGLLETCAPVQTPTCYAYVEGVVDALQSTFSAPRMQQHALFCLPQGVISRQLVDIAINYLHDHPEQRHNVASANVALALANAFPCPK